MAPRPTWSGQLRISLVSFPIQLYPASEAGPEIAFHQIHRPTGKRVRQQLVVPEVGPVDRGDIVKGYEYAKGHYVTFEPEELQEVRMPQRHTLDMVQFVKIDEIDPMYFDRPYYLTPDGHAAVEPFAVIRDALRSEGKAGIGEIVFAGKEHLVAVRPSGKGMILETLRYGEEVRKSDAYFEDIEKVAADEDQLDLAKSLITKKTAPFQVNKYHDQYIEAVRQLIKAKVDGKELPEVEDDQPTNVVNLMDALKRSVAESGKADITPRPASKKTAGHRKPATKRKAG